MPLLTRRRTVFDHEVQEPTLLALALALFLWFVLLGACVLGILFVSAFGYVGWTGAGLALILAWLVWGLRLRPAPASLTPRQQAARGIHWLGRCLCSGVLASWLGLIIWLFLAPGGPDAPPRDHPEQIRIITWNIHCGQDEGLPWKQFDWPARKHSLRSALEQADPDLLCVQEATPQQVAFLEEMLPEHHRVGVGRDDGKSGGEHCAIYFRRQRFAELEGSTFWLEEPIDQPRVGNALDIKRICTWVRLRERSSQRLVRVYNTHLYLTEGLRRHAARIILDHIAGGDPGDAVVLTADFNASPQAPSRQLFLAAGLADSAERAGALAGRPTFQLYGIGLWCIDGILVDAHWRVARHHVLDVKPLNYFPSDHFALLADLEEK